MRFPDHLPISDEVLRIARRLEDQGFETWCVGGAVRDNLLGLTNKDFDLTTAATPQDVMRLFRRTVPVGVEHGTVAVLDRHNQPHEVTTFRRDVETDGRHAVVAFGVSLDQDLARRDFTINAIAYHPLKHEWRDLFGGAEDLEGKTIRAVGDPAQRFREDYLRILRALRFAARFGFQIDRDTWEAAKGNVEGLKRLSAERVREEWLRGLKTAREPSTLYELWRQAGALTMWLSELVSGERYAGGPRAPSQPDAGGPRATSEPAGGPPAHRAPLAASETPATQQVAGVSPPAHRAPLTVIDELPPDPVLITSYLSADPVATLMRLRCSNAEIERGRRIAEHRQAWPEPVSEVAVRRWLARVGPAADDLLNIAEAEGWGDALVEAVGRVVRAKPALTVADLAITGDDLLAAGVPQGPAVGETLRMLLDRVLEDPSLNTRDRLLNLVSGQRYAGGPHPASKPPGGPPAHGSPLTSARRKGRGK